MCLINVCRVVNSGDGIKSSRAILINGISMNNLDNLRALAIGAVYLHHLAHVSHIPIPFFEGPGGPMLGLHLFFLLSGYFITQSAEKYSFGVYVTHRIARIFPAYLFVFLVFGFATNVIGFEKIIQFPGQFVSNLTLVQQLYPESLLRYDVTHVSWSLTVEIIWYLAAPLTLFGIRKRPFSMLFGSIFVSTAWVVMAQMGRLDMLYSSQIVGNLPYRFLFINNNFVGYYCFFVMGGVVFVMRDRIGGINNMKLMAIFTVLVSFYPTWYPLVFYPFFLTGIGISALLIIALNSPTLESRVSKWIADISFSIYLIHFIILDVVFNHWRVAGWGGVLISTTFTLLLASLSYRWLEKPFMELARHVTKRNVVSTCDAGGLDHHLFPPTTTNILLSNSLAADKHENQ